MTFSSEVMLLDWSETAKGGAKIVLQLPTPEDLEPFKAMTLAKRGVAGQRLMAVFAEIGDDEQPVPASEINSAPIEFGTAHKKGGALARLAGIWCADPSFQCWLAVAHGSNPEPEADVDNCPRLLRKVCQVRSRADLDHDQDAAERFHQLIRLPYRAYLASVGVVLAE